MVKLQGRIFARERLVKATNQKVTFYTLSTIKGYVQLNIDKDVSMKNIEVPGLVEVEVTGAKVKRTTTEDGREFSNTIAYATSVKNVASLPDFEAYEQAKLEKTLNDIQG